MMGRPRYKWSVRRVLERTRYHYWTVRAFVEGWVLLLVRRGPRAVWKRLTHAPVIRPANFGFSRIARGYDRGPDIKVTLTPPGLREPAPLIVSPSRVRNFARDVFPADPPNPYLAAAVAMEEEHGTPPLTGDPLRDIAWVSMGPLLLCVAPDGGLSLQARSIHRSPSEDAALFDVVDVVLPLYLAATAISSGAYDRLLRVRNRKRRRYRWELEIGERITFPTPLAGSHAIGFPGRIPASIPLGGSRPEPSEVFFRGWHLSRRHCRPERLVKFVLAELIAHWGYENDPEVVSDIMAALRSIRTGWRADHPTAR